MTRSSARRVRRLAAAWLLAALAAVPAALAEGFDVVVIDAGHGGEDEGAGSRSGVREKNLVLDVTHRLARRLRARGLGVVLTRRDDTFVPLEARTAIANDARGDLFLSIHANAAPDAVVRGTETYFLSLDPSDEQALRVAKRENRSFPDAGPTTGAVDDPLLALMGDLMHTEHLRESSEFARMAQRELAGLDPARSRGVKQAPFVVLMAVQMPASLVEIGFLTNREDARRLATAPHRDRVVRALERAVLAFGERYDARRGVRGRAARAAAAAAAAGGGP